jgi:hypothetical protein
MKTTCGWRVKLSSLVCASAAVLIGAGSAFGARPITPFNAAAVPDLATVRSIENASKGRLLAIGRIDQASLQDSKISLLGQDFILLASSSNLQFLSKSRVGRPVALFGEIGQGKYFVDAVLELDGQYVPGASKVFLRGAIRSNDVPHAAMALGGAVLDTSALASRLEVDQLTSGSLTAVAGTQPSIGGRVLVESISIPGRVRVDASLGTGRTDASLGTGRTNASLGTGRTDASLGTGRTDASLGTGRTDASLGTGRTNASLGTGRTDASLGTGRTDASLGTGRTDASLGTGRTDASLGTGRTDASLGTGRTNASLGTGRTDASLGTGRTEASLGTGF